MARPTDRQTPNQHIRERGNGVNSRISSGGVDPKMVDPTTATPSKPPSASNINFAENSKNIKPTSIKAILVCTLLSRKIISFADYSNDDEDWHGYDSDRSKDPFLDVIADKVKDDLFDKDNNLLLLMGVKGCDHNDDIGRFIPLSESKIKEFTVSELKSNLSRREVRPNPKRKKVMFRYQLTKAINEKKTIPTEDDANSKCLKGFLEGEKWKPLKPNEESLIEPDNIFLNAQSPTVPGTDRCKVPVKRNFDGSFAQGDFTGKCKMEVRDDILLFV